MPLASAAFLTLSLVLAVLFGNQTASWSWGPALLALWLGCIPALIQIWRERLQGLTWFTLILGLLTVGWFFGRAQFSEVRELAQADQMLMAGVLGSAVCLRSISTNPRASLVFHSGVALLLLANLIVVAIQLAHPGFRPLLVNTNGINSPTGFFSHYNYFANYLMVSTVWLASQAWMGRHATILRVVFGLLAIAGLAGIWFTGSRGGLLAAVFAGAVFAILLVLDGYKRKATWFPLAAILLPILGVALIGLLIHGWQGMQANRSRDGVGDLQLLMDNVARLSFYGLAVSTMLSHLWIGGGSQSFSWESYQFWDPGLGHWMNRPEFVHNEFLQAATDYGLIGFLLLLALLVTIVISAILHLVLDPQRGEKSDSSLCVAGLAGLAGLLAHSCFSFVFHLMPGALLLGMCLAASTSHLRRIASPLQHRLRFGLIGAIALIFLGQLAVVAWGSTRALVALWPEQYSKHRSNNRDAEISGLTEAIDARPVAALFHQRGLLHHASANGPGTDALESELRLAMEDYRNASDLNPYSPETELNLAKVFSRLQQPQEAEQRFQRAIFLQGGLDVAFRAHYHFALHFYEKGVRQLEAGESAEALVSLESAAEQIDKTVYWGAEIRNARVQIHEFLGIAHELNGMNREAFQSYEHAATLYGHRWRGIYLRSAMLMASQANRLRSERQPGKALQRYLYARNYVNMTHGKRPGNITAAQRDAFVRKLDDNIRQLREIGIQPEK